MNSRRRVNSDVMQLSFTMNRISSVAALSLMTLAASACHRAAPASVHVLLCDLYRNPSVYDGRTIIVTATITQLPNGKYLYPGSPSDVNYSFIKVDANRIRTAR